MTNNNHSTIVNFIWQVADDILRDIYVKGKYRDVILPMTVITRIDSELAETKEKVLKKYQDYKMSKKPRKDTESQNYDE